MNKVPNRSCPESHDGRACVASTIEFNKNGTCVLNGDLCTADELYSYLEGSPDELWETHPKFILQDFLLVIPNSSRPFMEDRNGKWMTDNWTRQYQKIFWSIQNYKKRDQLLETSQDVPQDPSQLMYMVFRQINNLIDKSSAPAKKFSSNRPGILGGIKGKKGQLRLNMLGKNVGSCARAVIIGDSTMAVDEIGVPEYICDKTCYPVPITPWNFEKLKRDYVDTKKYVRVKSPDGESYRYLRGEVKEEYGWTLYRKIQDGDYAIFNRQPTLHMGSFMAYRVKKVPGMCIRINDSSAASYNADHDGDEGNLHFPTTLDSAAEFECLFNMKYHIVSPNGDNRIGLIQNSVLAMYRLSRPDCFLDFETGIQLLYESNYGYEDRPYPEPCIIYKDENGQVKRKFTGLQILGYFLNGSHLNDETPGVDVMEVNRRPYFDKKSAIVVRNGEYLAGIVNERELGTKGRLIRQCWYRDVDLALKMITSLQRLGDKYVYMNGTSVDLGDCQFESPETKAAFRAWLSGAEYSSKNFEFRLQVEKTRSQIQRDLVKCIDNSFLVMTASGSKGSMNKMGNIASMTEFLGEQGCRGKIPKFLGSRTLPTLKPHDEENPLWNSFVTGNLLDGLEEPASAFLAMITGRSQVMERSLSTYKAGELNRTLAHRMGDYIVEYDWTVRDGEGVICQFEYGGNSLDPKFAGCFELTRNEQMYLDFQLKSEPLLTTVEEKELWGWLNGKMNFRMRRVLYGYFCANWKRGKTSFRVYMDDLKLYLERHLIEPGTPIGVVVALLLGEPLTHRRLDALHENGGGVEEDEKEDLEEILKRSVPSEDKILKIRAQDSRGFFLAHNDYSKFVLNYTRRSNLDLCKVDWWVGIYDSLFFTEPQEILDSKSFFVLCLKGGKEGDLNHFDVFSRIIDRCLKENKHRYFRLSPENMKGAMYLHFEAFDEEDVKKVIAFYLATDLKIEFSRFTLSEELKPNKNDEKTDSNGSGFLNRACVKIHTKHSLCKVMREIPGVDHLFTTTNDHVDVTNILGIEAGRYVLLKHLVEDGDLKLNRGHCEFIADIIFYKGEIAPMTPGGLARTAGSYLKKAAYRDSIRTMVSAATSNSCDGDRSVFTNVLCGIRPPLGTGFGFQVFGEKNYVCPVVEQKKEENATSYVSGEDIQSMIEHWTKMGYGSDSAKETIGVFDGPLLELEDEMIECESLSSGDDP